MFPSQVPMLGESEQLGQKGRREIPMPSLRRSHGSSPYRPLMVHISTRNIIRASQLALGIPPMQHPRSLEHPPPSRGRPPSSGSNHDSPGRQCPLWCRFQHDENLSPEANSRIHPTPNDVQRPLAVPHHQPNGHNNSREDLPFPKWYDPDATCAYHGKTPGHSTENA